MMPREEFLLVRTKPYLHDDQTTREDVLHKLLTQQKHDPDAEELLKLEDTSELHQDEQFIIYEGVPATDGDVAAIADKKPS